MNLADPYLKTERARVHLEALRNELELFYKSKPYTFRPKDDVKRQRYCLGVDFKETPDPIHLIVGDFVSCLRASLDQLVWALAKANTPRSYPRWTQFPILKSRDKEVMRVGLRGVATEAKRLVDSFQPYHGGNADAVRSHLLYRLNALCNIDKHRRIPVLSSGVHFHLPQSLMLAIKFDEADKVCWVPLHRKSEVRVYPNITFSVSFGDLHEGVACDFDGLDAMYHFVSDKVIPGFTRFF